MCSDARLRSKQVLGKKYLDVAGRLRGETQDLMSIIARNKQSPIRKHRHATRVKQLSWTSARNAKRLEEVAVAVKHRHTVVATLADKYIARMQGVNRYPNRMAELSIPRSVPQADGADIFARKCQDLHSVVALISHINVIFVVERNVCRI